MKIELLESPRRVDFTPPDRPLIRAALIGGPLFDGFDGFQPQLGGVWVEPTASVLGLPAFNDAEEGTDPLYVFYELEKVLRMLLRQSPLALRIFASPLVVGDSDWDLDFVEDLLTRAVARPMLTAMLDLSADAENRAQRTQKMRAAWAADSLRWSLAALLLAHGKVGFHLETLAKHHDLSIEDMNDDDRIEEARRLRDSVDAAENVLTPGPSDYNGLSDWLVDMRKRSF